MAGLEVRAGCRYAMWLRRRAREGAQREVSWSECQNWKWSVQRFYKFIRVPPVFVKVWEKDVETEESPQQRWASGGQFFPVYMAACICLRRSFNGLLRFLPLILQFWCSWKYERDGLGNLMLSQIWGTVSSWRPLSLGFSFLPSSLCQMLLWRTDFFPWISITLLNMP